jgi:hypothetical protein
MLGSCHFHTKKLLMFKNFVSLLFLFNCLIFSPKVYSYPRSRIETSNRMRRYFSNHQTVRQYSQWEMLHAYDVFNILKKIKVRDPDFNGNWIPPFSSLTDFLVKIDERFHVTFKTPFLEQVEKESQSSPFNISQYSRSSEDGYLSIAP